MNALMECLQGRWAELVGWTLLHSLWQVAIAAGVYALAVLALRKASPSVRYIAGCSAMLLMLAMPIATYVWLSSGEVEVERPASATAPAQTVATVADEALPVEPIWVDLDSPASKPVVVVDAPPIEIAMLEELPDVAVAPPVVPVVSPVAVESEPPPAEATSDPWRALRPWLPWATAVWLVGVLCLSLRPAWGWMHVRRLRRVGVTPLSSDFQAIAGRVMQRLGMKRVVQFAQSALVEVPTVVGYLRPMVLLPASAVTGLSVSELEMVLAHELAHIRRHDCLVNFLQTLAEALLFYHPAMWWVSGRIRVERENCCDDMAVAMGGDRKTYIMALARLEEQRAEVAVATLSVAGGSLLSRVRRLLGQPDREFGYGSATVWFASVAALVVAVAIVLGGYLDSAGEAEALADEDDLEVEVEEEPLAPFNAPYKGPVDIAASSDGERLYVAEKDDHAVAVVDLATDEVLEEITLPGEVTGVSVSPDGETVYATCGVERGFLCFIDAEAMRFTNRIPVGHSPRGLSVSPDGKRVFVCNRFDNDVSVIDIEAGEEVTRVQCLREPFDSAITPDGKTLFVTNHPPGKMADRHDFAGTITSIDTETLQSTAIRLQIGATNVKSIAVSPDGKYAVAVLVLSRYQIPTTQLERGWVATNAIAVIDAKEKRLINTVLLDDIDLGAANPYDVAFSEDGSQLAVTHSGSQEVSVIDFSALLKKLLALLPDREGDGSYSSMTAEEVPNDLAFLRDIRRRVKLTGLGPRGAAFVGNDIYCAMYFSDQLNVVDLTALPRPTVSEIKLGPDPVLSEERRGELLFHDATICFQQWLTCATCHPDARTDALNWDIMSDGMGNPKDTKSMLLAHATPPSMISGVRADAETAVRAALRHQLFDVHPEEDARAIDAYLMSLRPTPSPHLVDGMLSPSALRGKALFEREDVGCATCHPAPLYTDMKMHDVGSRGEYDRRDTWDTPTLIECWRTGPYMHDGRYMTVKEVFAEGNHGLAKDKLTDAEIDDLTEFVLSLSEVDEATLPKSKADLPTPSDPAPSDLTFGQTVANEVVRQLKEAELPFLDDEDFTRIRDEFQWEIDRAVRHELTDERKQAIFDAIDGHLMLGNGELPGLDHVYLSLPDQLDSLRWKIVRALRRGPLYLSAAERYQSQRQAMREYIMALPEPGGVTREETVDDLNVLLADPLCTQFDRPMTEEQFERFQEELAKDTSDYRINYIVSRMSHTAFSAATWFTTDLAVFLRNETVHYNCLSGRPTLQFRSNLRFRGKLEMVLDMHEHHTVIDVSTGETKRPPGESSFFRDDNHRKIEPEEFAEWLADNGDFAFDAEAGGLTALRGAKLALLDVDSWLEADTIGNDVLREQIIEQGKPFFDIIAYYEANGMNPKDLQTHYEKPPFVGVLSKEGDLAVVAISEVALEKRQMPLAPCAHMCIRVREPGFEGEPWDVPSAKIVESEQQPAEKPNPAHPDNPLRFDDETLIELYQIGKVMARGASTHGAYRRKTGEWPKPGDLHDLTPMFLFRPEGFGDTGNDIFLPGSDVRFIPDPKDEDLYQIWSVGPDGDWDGGKPGYTVEWQHGLPPRIEGDLGVEMRVGEPTSLRWIADETLAMHLKGDRLPHYLASRGPKKWPKPQLGDDGLNWGPEVDGLQMAVELKPLDDKPGNIDQAFEIHVHVRNVADYAIPLIWSTFFDALTEDRIEVRDASGNVLKSRAKQPPSGIAGRYENRTLYPGDRTSLVKGRVAFVSPKRAWPPTEREATAFHCLQAPAGDHTVTLHYSFANYTQPFQYDCWTGTLKSGRTKISIVEEPSFAIRGVHGYVGRRERPSENGETRESLAWHRFREKGNRNEIFNAMKPERYPVDLLLVDSPPIVTDADIISYDWDTHILQLTPEAYQRLKQIKPSVWGVPFVIEVDCEPIYLGAFWSVESSYSADMPTILLDPAPGEDGSRDLPENAIRIDLSTVVKDGEEPIDPRGDERIRKVLEQAGKLAGDDDDVPTAKGAEFLAGIPEFAELSRIGLDITPERLREIIERGSLAVSIDENETSFHIYARSGENVVVMFDGDECKGIQRMRPDAERAKERFKEDETSELPTLRVRAVDTDGDPIAGASVLVYLKHLLGSGKSYEDDWKRTGSDGWVDMGALPQDTVCVLVHGRENEFDSMEVNTLGEISSKGSSVGLCGPENPFVQWQLDKEANTIATTFTMRRGVDLEFQAVDANTREPMRYAQVFYWDEKQERWWQPFRLGGEHQTNYWPISEDLFNLPYRIAAEGYYPVNFHLDEDLELGKKSQHPIELAPAPDIRFTVLTPDGQPAEGAKLAWHALKKGLGMVYGWPRATNAQGLLDVRYPAQGDLASFEITHPTGKKTVRMKDAPEAISTLTDDGEEHEVIEWAVQLLTEEEWRREERAKELYGALDDAAVENRDVTIRFLGGDAKKPLEGLEVIVQPFGDEEQEVTAKTGT